MNRENIEKFKAEIMKKVDERLENKKKKKARELFAMKESKIDAKLDSMGIRTHIDLKGNLVVERVVSNLPKFIAENKKIVKHLKAARSEILESYQIAVDSLEERSKLSKELAELISSLDMIIGKMGGNQ